MYCTIKHSTSDGRAEIYHGYLWWLDRDRGTFMFQTQRDGHAVEFWCKNDWWEIHDCPVIIGRITVSDETDY